MPKAVRCQSCGKVVAVGDLLECPPDGDWLFTLEDDDEPEKLCPHCFHADSQANWGHVFWIPSPASAPQSSQKTLFSDHEERP